ncbi:hypothetical protein EHQ68_14355 [Leptospira congkakensis]|uniref:Uncharacterized protein n=1 Tax=Leptospira congkakensis TaxID=2484932 RepID=A0A4Z1AFI2_9LEPT|nr:hypothetical protein EHQ68_14355 [Leptospira congkakensis]TGL94294.1 hypothetical protein EHQ69_05675 [Leptospira congkakensis]TGL95062.1 hypothetical protein EHQ70_15120 [Leptospira congkakensis]
MWSNKITFEFIFLILFCLTWILCFIPQIKVYLPQGKLGSIHILYAEGASFLCFCFLSCSCIDYKNKKYWQGIAIHEFVHQRQQRLFSPFVFGILYFGEWIFRKFYYKQSWSEAYRNLRWEKEAEVARLAFEENIS